ncbi:MAG: hypothetical protein IPK16_21645 [Anaerolineales bacterium]|nr:hypothetical protein [Anaerolineales bacterium]
MNLAAIWWTLGKLPNIWVYTSAFVGHALLDRLWLFPDTFLLAAARWRFHVWGKRGSEQKAMRTAYWVAFTRRPELWGWELGGFIALGIFIWRKRLYRRDHLLSFLLTGRTDLL